MTKRKILVTTALNYANGDLHLGHLIEQTQADIWARFQRMCGNDCYYICGIDAHGTPIMLMAEKLGKTPEAMVAEFQKRQRKDAEDFLIHFDHFGSTHDHENHLMVTAIYDALKINGYITSKEIEQAFDPEKKMFLPDRFVKGACPRCGAPDQYGDNCEQCGATYSPLDLKNPRSVLSGATPISKKSHHFFFDLPQFETFLKTWLKEKKPVQAAVVNKLQEWFEHGLQAWDISRDAPYFGFKIPETHDKYFYVWLDAPVGYLSIFKEFCIKSEKSFEDFWNPDAKTEVIHFIGKDIVYFHALFWPAMLKGVGYREPSQIAVHGYLGVNGQKMSKSRGTFIKARTYLNHLPPEALRFYFASKLTSSVDDIDFNLNEFRQKVNSDIVGKVVNLASRAASFINKNFDNQLSVELADPALLKNFANASDEIAEAYESRDYARAIRLIMNLADQANQFFDQEKPWAKMKVEGESARVHAVCSQSLNHFRQLLIYLKPVMPALAEAAEQFLMTTNVVWSDAQYALLNHTIRTYQPLYQRIEESSIMSLEQEMKVQAEAVKAPEPVNEENPHISIDDFMKVDLRIARIVNAEEVPEANKLLKLQLDIGEEKPRQVFAGIKSSFKPEDLIGKFTVMVANLAPRKMRFGMSEGMVIVASKPDGDQLYLIEPQAGADPGMRVK